MAPAAQLLTALLAPSALALKSNLATELKSSLAAEWDSNGSEVPLTLARSNVSMGGHLEMDEEFVVQVAKDFFPQANISIALTQAKTSSNLQSANATGIGGTCVMSAEERCPMSSFKTGVPTMVYPGGETRCIFGDDYAFSVFPGATDRVLIFFEGGGNACWDEATSLYQPACKTTCTPASSVGPYNNCAKNPFRKHTVVFIQSCSGDMHLGQKDRPWRNPVKPGVPVAQRGYANARAVIDWVKDNTASKLSNFALSGESAGAIGLQMWSSTLLAEFSYEKAAVLADSYMGVFPRGFQGPVFKSLGACETGLFSDEVNEWCNREDASVEEVYSNTVRKFRNVMFGHIVSKHDIGQMLFYNIARQSQQLNLARRFCGKQGLPFGNQCNMGKMPSEISLTPKLVEFADFHRKLQVVVDRFSMEPNYVSYLMTGMMHPILPFTFGECPGIDYHKVNTDGWLWGAGGRQRWSVQEWVKDFFLMPKGAPHRSRCEQLSLYEDDYCIPLQMDKELHVAKERSA